MRKKLITKILLFIFVFISISLFFSSPLALPAPQYARAAITVEGVKNAITNPAGTALYGETTYPNLEVPVGGFTKDSFKKQPPENWLGVYILAWFNYLVGAIGIIAVVMIMWGGILWITAGGNASQIDNAKGKIKNAVIGIVLLLCTYTIFKTINPRMLSLQLPTIEPVAPIEYCCWNKQDKSILKIKYDEECDNTTETTLPLDDCKKSGEAIKAGCPSGTTGMLPTEYLTALAVARIPINTEQIKKLGEQECNKKKQVYVKAEKISSNGNYIICYTCKE